MGYMVHKDVEYKGLKICRILDKYKVIAKMHFRAKVMENIFYKYIWNCIFS